MNILKEKKRRKSKRSDVTQDKPFPTSKRPVYKANQSQLIIKGDVGSNQISNTDNKPIITHLDSLSSEKTIFDLPILANPGAGTKALEFGIGMAVDTDQIQNIDATGTAASSGCGRC